MLFRSVDQAYLFVTVIFPMALASFSRMMCPSTLHIVSEWFEEEFKVLPWPPNSPDLNPIKHSGICWNNKSDCNLQLTLCKSCCQHAGARYLKRSCRVNTLASRSCFGSTRRNNIILGKWSYCFGSSVYMYRSILQRNVISCVTIPMEKNKENQSKFPCQQVMKRSGNIYVKYNFFTAEKKSYVPTGFFAQNDIIS